MEKKIISLLLATMLVVSVSNTGAVFAASKSSVFVDRKEKLVQSSKKSTKVNQTEKQRLLSAVSEMSCTFRDVLESLDPKTLTLKPDLIAQKEIESKAKIAFAKYGFKTDEKSLAELGEKYRNDMRFAFEMVHALTSCTK